MGSCARQMWSFVNFMALQTWRGRFAWQPPARSGARRKAGNMCWSIRVRLTIAFMGLAIGPLLLVGVVLAWRSYTLQQQQALYLQRQMAQRVATQVTAFFAELENELRVVSKVQGLAK